MLEHFVNNFFYLSVKSPTAVSEKNGTFSFRCYLQACKCQYLFFGPLLLLCVAWNDLIEGNIVQMFSDENVFWLFSYPISLAATEGTCSG